MKFQSTVRIVGWIELISSTIILILFLLCAYALFSNPSILRESVENDPDIDMRLVNANVMQKIGYMTPGFLYFIGEIFLGAYLINAANELNYKKLRLWYVITATYSTIIGIILVPTFLTMNNVNIEMVLMIGLSYSFTAYSLYVVHLLRTEIKKNTLPQVHFHGGMPIPPPTYEEASFGENSMENKKFMAI